ncbi:mob1 phocein family protein, partial [Cystoisospora suis]
MNYLTSWRLPRASARKAAVETTGQPVTNCKKSQRFHQPARNQDYDQDSGRNSEHEGFLAHPPRWAMTLTAARASLGNQVLPLAVKMPATC